MSEKYNEEKIEKRHIRVIKEGCEPRNLMVEKGLKNDLVKKSVITQNFGKGRLVFKTSGNIFIVDVNDAETHFVLPDGINDFHFEPFNDEAVGAAKRSRFQDMLDALRKKNDGIRSRKMSNASDGKILNKKCAKENTSPNKRLRADGSLDDCNTLIPAKNSRPAQVDSKNCLHVRRVIHLRCLYKNYLSEDFHVKGITTVELNGNKDYSIESLKKIFQQKLVETGALTQDDITPNECIIQIGFLNGSPIDYYEDDKGNPCDFWTFSKRYRDKRHTLRLALLVTKIARSPNHSDDDSNSSDNERYPRKPTKSGITLSSKDHGGMSSSTDIVNLIDDEDNNCSGKTSRPKQVINNHAHHQTQASTHRDSGLSTNPTLPAHEEFDDFNQDDFSNWSHEINRREAPPFSKSIVKESSSIQDSSESTDELKEENVNSGTFFSSEERDVTRSRKVDLAMSSSRAYKGVSSKTAIYLDHRSNESVAKNESSSPNTREKDKDTPSYGNEECQANSEIEMTKSPFFANTDCDDQKNDDVLQSACKQSSQPLDPNNLRKSEDVRCAKKVSLLDQFKIDESEIEVSDVKLGGGSQGVVMKGTFKMSPVAIKIMLRGNVDQSSKKEIALLMKVPHPNIVQIMAWCETPTQIYIITEYVEGHNLWDVIMKKDIRQSYNFSSVEAKNLGALQIARALAFCHFQKPEPIVHRDLKPGNIMINRALLVKVCDFGFGKCKSLSQSLISTFRGHTYGTYSYMPPEVLLDEKDGSTQGDMWSFACTLVEMYNEEYLWREKGNQYAIALKNLSAKKIPDLVKVPEYLRKILSRSFSYEPTSRPGIGAFVNLLSICPRL